MSKKEHFLATGAGLLFIGAIVVMIVFIVLWSRCKDLKHKRCNSCCSQKCSDNPGCMSQKSCQDDAEALAKEVCHNHCISQGGSEEDCETACVITKKDIYTQQCTKMCNSDSGGLGVVNCGDRCVNDEGFRCCMASTYRGGSHSNMTTKACIRLSNNPNDAAQCLDFFPEN